MSSASKDLHGKTVFLKSCFNKRMVQNQGDAVTANQNTEEWEQLEVEYRGADDVCFFISRRDGRTLQCDPVGKVTFSNENRGELERWKLQFRGSAVFLVAVATNKTLQVQDDGTVVCANTDRGEREAFNLLVLHSVDDGSAPSACPPGAAEREERMPRRLPTPRKKEDTRPLSPPRTCDTLAKSVADEVSLNGKGGAREVHSAQLEMIESLIKQGIKSKKFAGMCIGIARDSRMCYQKSFGSDDLKKKTKLKDSAIFKIMSMTKLFTATAVMILVDRNELALDDELAKYIPSYSKATVYAGKGKAAVPVKSQITIRHLLTHTSGLFYDFMPEVPEDLKKIWRSHALKDHAFWNGKKWYDIPAKVPLSVEPGTCFQYGVSYDILGRVVEVIAKKTLGEFIEENICGPLGLKDTRFYLTEEEATKRLAANYKNEGKLTQIDHDWIWKEPPGKNWGRCDGGGGLYSTVADCVRFGCIFTGDGEVDGKRILSRSSVKAMCCTYQWPVGTKHPYGDGAGYGLGGLIIPGLGGTWGWDGMLSTSLKVLMDKQCVIVSMRHVQPPDTPFNDQIRDIVLEGCQ